MRKVNTNKMREELWESPKGKFGGWAKQVSEALGCDLSSTDLRTCCAVASREGRKTTKITKKNRCQTFVPLPWKIDDFVDEVGGKNRTADYADYTDFLGLVVSVLTGRNR